MRRPGGLCFCSEGSIAERRCSELGRRHLSGPGCASSRPPLRDLIQLALKCGIVGDAIQQSAEQIVQRGAARVALNHGRGRRRCRCGGSRRGCRVGRERGGSGCRRVHGGGCRLNGLRGRLGRCGHWRCCSERGCRRRFIAVGAQATTTGRKRGNRYPQEQHRPGLSSCFHNETLRDERGPVSRGPVRPGTGVSAVFDHGSTVRPLASRKSLTAWRSVKVAL